MRITISVDNEVAFHEERIEGPVRVFFDLPSTRTAAPLADKTIRFDQDTDIVRQVRVGRHPNDTTRIVLDTLPTMRAAQALYRTLAFRPIAPYLKNPTPGALCFELRLS